MVCFTHFPLIPLWSLSKLFVLKQCCLCSLSANVSVAHVHQVWTSVSVCLFVLFLRFCLGLSPDLQSMEQIRRIMRPTDVPDQGLLCDLLWSDPDKDVLGWGENDRGVSFTFGSEVVAKFLHKHDLDLICRAHQVIPISAVIVNKNVFVCDACWQVTGHADNLDIKYC